MRACQPIARLAALVAAALVASCAASGPPPPAAPPAAPQAVAPPATAYAPAAQARLSGPELRLLDAVNATRRVRGLAALAPDARLVRMAEAQAHAMADQDFFAHRGPDGKGLTARLAEFRYAYSFAAENLAGGPHDADETVAGWMQSPPHRRNLLAPEAVAAGTGYAYKARDDGREGFHRYWVLVVAAPAEP